MTKNNKHDFHQLLRDVIEPGLCVRCGLCIGVCPVQVLKLNDERYPKLQGSCIACDACNACCPGGDVDYPALSRQTFGTEYDPMNLTGVVKNMFVAHAAEYKIRAAGNSGGAVTGLLLFLLKTGIINGAIVVGMDPQKPYLSKGILATSPEEILASAKSKYQITPAMEVMQILRKNHGRFAVVGLPCQIHGLRKLEQVSPELFKKIHCILGLFCHYNLEPGAIADIIRLKGIRPSDISAFAYRSTPRPGKFIATLKNGTTRMLFSIHIRTAINALFGLYSAKRCNICYDAFAEFADLSFGDFWADDYSSNLSKMKQCNIVYERTPKGAEIIGQAVAAKALYAQKLPPDRNSKRLLEMARGKKQKAIALLQYQALHDKKVPRYHFDITKTFSQEKLSLNRYRFYSWLRKSFLRKMVIIVLFSPPGKIIDYLNQQRQKWFHHFHGN